MIALSQSIHRLCNQDSSLLAVLVASASLAMEVSLSNRNISVIYFYHERKRYDCIYLSRSRSWVVGRCLVDEIRSDLRREVMPPTTDFSTTLPVWASREHIRGYGGVSFPFGDQTALEIVLKLVRMHQVASPDLILRVIKMFVPKSIDNNKTILLKYLSKVRLATVVEEADQNGHRLTPSQTKTCLT